MFISWIRSLFARKSTTYRRPVKAANRNGLTRFRPALEALEDRFVPTFLAPVPAVNVAANSTAVAVADFNKDGRADIVSQSSATGQMSVALGNGDNSFQTPTILTTPGSPARVLIADVNGDGNADILATYSQTNPGTGTTTGLSMFFGNGDGSFQAPISKDLGPGIVSVVTGDFNGDGKLDLFAVGSAAGPFQNTTLDLTYLGNGDGTFNNPTSSIVNGNGANVAVGDFNGDGKLDVAIADMPTLSASDLLTYNLTTLLGNGTGSFQLPVDQTVFSLQFGIVPPAGREPTIVTADVNGDGISDAVVTINRDELATVGGFFPPGTLPHGHARPIPVDTTASLPGVLTISLGSAAGLQAPVAYSPGDGAGFTHIVDVNHDGLPDLVIQNNGTIASDIPAAPGIFLPEDDGGVTVLLNQGGGTFGTPVNFVVPVAGPVVVGDFNGDGNNDLLISNNTILEGNGDGTFEGDASTFVGPGPNSMSGNAVDSQATGDFNSDGILDVAVTNAIVGTVDIFLGKGNGTFQNPTTYTVGTNGTSGSGARGIVTGDFNGDGEIDLAMVVEGAPGSVAIVYGNGDGTFQTPIFEGAGGQVPFTIAAADFNGDGLTDVVITDPVARTATIMESGPGGKGFVLPTTDQPTAVVGDFNGDGRPDLATNSTVYLNKGTAGFVAVSTLSVGSGADEEMAVGDFNGDGKLDIAVHNNSVDSINFGIEPLAAGAVGVLLGNGDGTFSALTPATPAQPIPLVAGGFYQNAAGSSIVVADLNGDGIPDLLVNGINAVEISLGRGDGGFYPEQTASATAGIAGQLAVGDFNNDGLLDVAEVDQGANYVQFSQPAFENVLLSAGFASQPQSSAVGFKISAPATVTDNDPFAVTVSAVDANGNVVSGFLGTVYIYGDQGMATPYAFTAADAGTHTVANAFSFSGGTHRVSASAPFMTAATASVSAAPGNFSISLPSTTVAGAPLPITINALDAFGNPLPSFTGSVTVTSSDPQVKPLIFTFNAGDAGTLTLSSSNFALFTAGNETLTLSFPTMNSVTSAPVFVTPAAQTKVVISAPAVVQAGTPFNFSVSVFDIYNNFDPTATPTIALSTLLDRMFSTQGDSRATLPANYTYTAADAGVHQFSATLITAGQTWILSSGDAGGSDLVTVKPSAVTSLSMTTLTQLTAGTSVGLTVSGLDAFGNVAPGALFHLTNTDPQAILPPDALAASATSSVTFKTAGMQTLTLTDLNDPSVAPITETVFVAPAAASYLQLTGVQSTTAGTSQTFTVTARDAFGNVATTFTGPVSFSSSDAQASLPLAYTFTAADAGTHTFAATLKTAGTQAIAVTDTAVPTILGSQSGIVITSALTTGSITITGFPATMAGAAQTFTVTIRDPFGNLGTNYRGTVMFSSSDAQAGLPASYTFTAADAGVRTFSATLKKAGTQSITVMDSASSTIMGTQTGIAVSAGVAAQFSISAPISVTQGAGFKFTMTVLDAYGNVVTGYLGKVHLSSTDAKGGTSDYTFSKNDNGVHVFSYTFNTLGSQTLKIVDTTNSSFFATDLVNVLARS